ncbi:amino acid adenylation domain protein (plasmid) [Calothrix brevissima NIES-22]|nr:amino acid adenylation domain protein [Calothrix brevissima NIES-22]
MSSEEVFVFPVSFAQQRLWFFDQLIPNNTLYNVPTVIRLTGLLNLTALEQTFNEIVRRYETLRTTFIVLDGQPLQAIAPSLTIPISVLDLQQLSADEREVEAKSIVTAEIEHPFDLSSGPTMMRNLHPGKRPQVHHAVAYKDYLLGMRPWLCVPFHWE